MTQRIIVSLVVLASTFVFSPAFTCTCGKVSLEKHFEIADAVFQGYPVLARLDQRPAGELGIMKEKILSQVVIEFRVTKWWKGGGTDTVTVSTGMGGGDCGSEFHIGTRYVVFAGGSRDKGYGTSICMGNMFADTAAREIQELDRLAQPKKQ